MEFKQAGFSMTLFRQLLINTALINCSVISNDKTVKSSFIQNSNNSNCHFFMIQNNFTKVT